MLPQALRRALLRLGYRLPSRIQRIFHRSLYDGPRPGSGERLIVSPDRGEQRVRFEFVGGCRDGQVFEGLLANPFYWKSNHGTVGTRFLVASEAAVDAMMRGEPTGPILKHEYEVVENRLEDGITWVRVEAR